MPSTSKRTAATRSVGRRIAADWLPPKVVHGLRRLRAARPAAVPAPAAPAPAKAPAEPVPQDPRWAALTERTLAGLETCDPVYRPTSFWGPGVHRLLGEIEVLGLETFKSWPEAFFWFYPVYGKRLPAPVLRRMVRLAEAEGTAGAGKWLRTLVDGVTEARRDYDVARTAWNQQNWPMDLESFGESEVGKPTQLYRLVADRDAPNPSPARLTKPYLNYLLCLAALSRHVDEPPRSFLELGGGYGVLGEIVLARDPEARYVNCDIPPLLTISSYYLTELFGDDRLLTFDDRVADSGPVDVPDSACLPNWRMADLSGDYDVFVNSFSFQEMEPPVVEHYVETVAALGVRYVVSLNSRRGKPVSVGDSVGVKEQVVSAMVIEMFERRGYELCATYNEPMLVSRGELAVLRRR